MTLRGGTWSRVPAWLVLYAMACVTLFTFSQIGHAASAPNAQSPLGMNLSFPNQWSTEDPFLNLFNCNTSWTTSNQSTWDTGEESSLQLDSNGYPISLVANPVPAGGQQFPYVLVALNCGASSGRSGQLSGRRNPSIPTGRKCRELVARAIYYQLQF